MRAHLQLFAVQWKLSRAIAISNKAGFKTCIRFNTNNSSSNNKKGKAAFHSFHFIPFFPSTAFFSVNAFFFGGGGVPKNKPVQELNFFSSGAFRARIFFCSICFFFLNKKKLFFSLAKKDVFFLNLPWFFVGRSCSLSIGHERQVMGTSKETRWLAVLAACIQRKTARLCSLTRDRSQNGPKSPKNDPFWPYFEPVWPVIGSKKVEIRSKTGQKATKKRSKGI